MLIYFSRHHHRHHSRHKHNEREIFIPKDDLQIDENLDEFLQDDLTSKIIYIYYLLNKKITIKPTNNTKCLRVVILLYY